MDVVQLEKLKLICVNEDRSDASCVALCKVIFVLLCCASDEEILPNHPGAIRRIITVIKTEIRHETLGSFYEKQDSI